MTLLLTLSIDAVFSIPSQFVLKRDSLYLSSPLHPFYHLFFLVSAALVLLAALLVAPMQASVLPLQHLFNIWMIPGRRYTLVVRFLQGD